MFVASERKKFDKDKKMKISMIPLPRDNQYFFFCVYLFFKPYILIWSQIFIYFLLYISEDFFFFMAVSMVFSLSLTE